MAVAMDMAVSSEPHVYTTGSHIRTPVAVS